MRCGTPWSHSPAPTDGPLETIQDTVGHANPRATKGYDHTDPALLTQPAEYLLAALSTETGT